MNKQNEKLREIVKTLKSGSFFIECPETGEEVRVRELELFDNTNFTQEALYIYEQQLEELKTKKEHLKKIKQAGATKSAIGAHSINIGFILERLAPTMTGFRFRHNDCRSIFDPIDYIIFEGLSEKGRISKIFFIDIKTGNAPLKPRQREIRAAINDCKVSFRKF